jgi:thiamine pyrophosphokinase
MNVHVFLYPFDYNGYMIQTINKEDIIIGADRGSLYLLKHHMRLDLAIGDFDSVTEKELSKIKAYAKTVEIYPSKKDWTDSFLAVKKAKEFHAEKIIVHGGIGGRISHTLANLMLLEENVTIHTSTKTLFVLNPGTKFIKNNKKYISFFALKEVQELTLKGFEFEMNNYNLSTIDPLCTSNLGSGTVSFKAGKLLCVLEE